MRGPKSIKDVNQSVLTLCSLPTQEVHGCLSPEALKEADVYLHPVEGAIQTAQPLKFGRPGDRIFANPSGLLVPIGVGEGMEHTDVPGWWALRKEHQGECQCNTTKQRKGRKKLGLASLSFPPDMDRIQKISVTRESSLNGNGSMKTEGLSPTIE